MTEKGERRIYEVGYLLLPSIPEEHLAKEVSEIKKLISDAGGEFISEEDPKLRPLAYEMVKLVGTRNEKFRSAYFGWVKFETTAPEVLVLKEKFDSKESILRHLLVKTVREDTYVPRGLATDEDGAQSEEVSSERVMVSPEEGEKVVDPIITE